MSTMRLLNKDNQTSEPTGSRRGSCVAAPEAPWRWLVSDDATPRADIQSWRATVHAVRLTTVAIGEMIRRMPRNVITGLLILGWITLSGFDLLEDFKHLHGHLFVSSASAPEPIKSRDARGTLVNNVVESATRVPDSTMAFSRSSVTIGDGSPIVDFRGYFLRHKLYRVFLI